ncbi:MAG: AMP-binding protein, partial [Spirochaetota bacterium]
MSLLNTYMPKTEFPSYEDFRDNFKVNIPENFNFAYDVVDWYAAHEPDRRALVWCNDNEEKVFTFADMKRMSDKAANMFTSAGIRKGDPVMLILKQRYEFWFCILGLHRIGAITIPATHMLTTHDVDYRIKMADIKMLVSVASDALNQSVDEAQKTAGILEKKMIVGGKRGGWISFDEEFAAAPESFVRPQGDAA